MFHQGLVDCGRASLLLLLGVGVLFCQRLPKCNIIETAFLLLVTVSTVNMLTSVINDASLLPDQDFQVTCLRMHFFWTHSKICSTSNCVENTLYTEISFLSNLVYHSLRSNKLSARKLKADALENPLQNTTYTIESNINQRCR